MKQYIKETTTIHLKEDMRAYAFYGLLSYILPLSFILRKLKEYKRKFTYLQSIKLDDVTTSNSLRIRILDVNATIQDIINYRQNNK